jgi:hypothetical protein
MVRARCCFSWVFVLSGIVAIVGCRRNRQDDPESSPPKTATTAAETQYTMQELGFLPGGDRSAAYDINADGVVVGISTAAPKGDTCWEPFRYTPAQGMHRLPGVEAGTCVGPGLPRVNEAGTIVFTRSTGTGANVVSLLWRYSEGRGLEPLTGPAGATLLQARDISEAGEALAFDFRTRRGYWYREGVGLEELPAPAGVSFLNPVAWDGSGNVVGYLTLADNTERAVRWVRAEGGGFTIEELNDRVPADAGARLEQGLATNGTIAAGVGRIGGARAAYLLDLSTGSLRWFGQGDLAGGFVWINDLSSDGRTAVGYTMANNQAPADPFIITRDGGFRRLNPLVAPARVGPVGAPERPTARSTTSTWSAPTTTADALKS